MRCVISCMALPELPPLAWGDPPPRFIQWPGEATGGHPDWMRAADKLRSPPYRKGRLLPALLRRYGVPTDVQVAVIGFSAGSNSGCRELLRNADDRAQIDACFQVDGLHAMRHPKPRSSAPRDQFVSYAGQVAMVVEYAGTAASGGRLHVQTSSQVASPNPRANFATWEMMPLIEPLAEEQVPPRLRVKAQLPPGFPNRTNHRELRKNEPYPRPIALAGLGNFLQLYYPGRDKRAHQLQAWVVAHDLIRELLLPRWKKQEV